jgi:integrase
LKRHFGDIALSSITAASIADFQHARHRARIANRTINMDVGVLSRVLKSCGRWLADHVKNLPERDRAIGRALTADERKRLFEAAAANPEWEHVYCAAVVAANTSMRPVEVKHLRRRDVDLEKKLVHVRRSKNETSHRVIPLNASAVTAITRMLERADLLGHRSPDHYVWPHTAITELAELGVADHVLESISGHLSRRMLEHYSHIRIDAKRQALDALDRSRRDSKVDDEVREGTNGDAAKTAASGAEIPVVVTLTEGLTSQFTSQSVLAGSPPHAKLLIPLVRRDVRVVEGARLEIEARQR